MHVIAGFEGIVLTFKNARELRTVAEHLQGFAEHAEADDPCRPRSYAIGGEQIPEALPEAAVEFEARVSIDRRPADPDAAAADRKSCPG